VTDWINSNAGLIILIFVALFLVTLAFQRTKGGPV
jgi:hypothetical protein